MKKLAFICQAGLDSFIHDIKNNLSNDYETNLYLVQSKEEIQEAVEWGDILWYEWANDVAVYGTRLSKIKPDEQKIIVRLHSYEALSGMAKNLHWKSVDACIFVAGHVKELMTRQILAFDEITKSYIIHNGINLNRFEFTEKEKGNNIAFLALISNKKGPMLLIHAFNWLSKQGNFELHIGGQIQEQRYNLYMGQIIRELGISEKVKFYGQVKNVNEWFKDKHFIINTSPWEGCPVGLLEAMACGLKPLIHNFPGAKYLFPKKWIWNDFIDVINMVEGDYKPKEYRKFVEKNFSLEKQMKEIVKVLKELEG